MSEVIKSNEALKSNPATTAAIKITTHGSDWLWAAFALITLATLIHAFFVFVNDKKGNRFRFFLHLAPFFSGAVIAFSYFTTAANLGWASVRTEFHHISIGDNTRQMFYARYVAWFLAWPGLLFLFELNAQAQHTLTSLDFVTFLEHLAVQLFAWESLVLSLLIGLLIHSTYKFGYFTIGVVMQLFGLTMFVKRQLFSDGRVTSGLSKIAVIVFTITFSLYSVCWGLSEGGNVIQPDSEAVFYGVLDVVNFVIIPVVLIFEALKQGVVIGAGASSATNDVEKNVANPPLRTSGETEVHA